MAQITQRSFTSGEIAPALRSRTDMVKYQTGLALCENFIVRPQGGVYSRPGTRFIGALDDSTRKGRLLPFSFNVEQTYVLVFEHLKLRVIKDGGFILDGGVIYEVASPYTEAQIPRIYITQDADVMTIVHPDHPPKTLSRVTETDWVFADIDFTPQVTPPTYISTTNYTITNVSNSSPCVVTVTNTSGLYGGSGVTITGVIDDGSGGLDLAGILNGNSFLVDNVTATTFELRDTDTTLADGYLSGGNAATGNLTPIGSGAGSFSKTYTYVITAVDENGVESLPSAPASITTPSLSSTAGIRIAWNAVSGASYYRVYKDPSVGTNIYGWIGDSQNTQFDDFNLAPITSDAPPVDSQPFSGADNYPSTVSYYQQRQVYANTYNTPQTVYLSQTAIYDSMRTSRPARADDAIAFTIKARQVNEIRHIVPLDTLIMLTSGGEWVVTEGQDQVLTPSTVGVRSQSFNGASWVVPVIINSTALFVQEKGTRVRDLSYEFASDKFTGNDLSLMSEHLFEGHTIVEMAFAQEPYGTLWCVRDDGILLCLTYQREHQVWGWHRHTTDGAIESISTVSEGSEDAVYGIVKRTINGQELRYVERMAARETANPADCFYVDCGLTYSGAPATIISGLDHLEGKDVAVLADGNEVTGLTVVGGEITLQQAASKVHVGLPYTPVIETLDIDTPKPQESFKPQVMSISEVVIEVQDSRGGFVGPIDDDGNVGEMWEVKPRFESDGYDTIALRSYKQIVTVDSQWNKGGRMRIEQRSPLPLAILSLNPKVDIGG